MFSVTLVILKFSFCSFFSDAWRFLMLLGWTLHLQQQGYHAVTCTSFRKAGISSLGFRNPMLVFFYRFNGSCLFVFSKQQKSNTSEKMFGKRSSSFCFFSLKHFFKYHSLTLHIFFSKIHLADHSACFFLWIHSQHMLHTTRRLFTS